MALFDPHAGSPAAGFFCGGVILDAMHVATAAHCVAGGAGSRATPSGDIEVLAGSTSLSSPEPGSVEDPVRSSSYDARYNPVTSDYDVALLTLERPLWASATPPAANGVNTIAPLAPDRHAAALYGNPNATPAVTVTASGWGDVNPAPNEGPSYPTSLRAVRMPLVSESVCEEEYGGIEQTITPRMICAGGGKEHLDTCYGDSGGPLLADADNPAHPPGDYVLVGLVDFGNGCAQAGYAGVYTRISASEITGFLDFGTGRTAKPPSAGVKHKRHKKHKGRR